MLADSDTLDLSVWYPERWRLLRLLVRDRDRLPLMLFLTTNIK